MLDIIDIVEFCRLHGDKLNNVTVYGKLMNKVSKPKSVSDTVSLSDGYCFYRFEAIAINLQSYKSELKTLGIQSVDNCYFVHGDLGVYLPENMVTNDWYQSKGVLRLGSRAKRLPVMGMFNFDRLPDNTWCLQPTSISDLNVEDFNLSSGRIYRYIEKSVNASGAVRTGVVTTINADNNTSLIQPAEVLDLNKFYYDEPVAMQLESTGALLDVHMSESVGISEVEQSGVSDKLEATDSKESIEEFNEPCDDLDTPELSSHLTFSRSIASSSDKITELVSEYNESNNFFLRLLRSNFPLGENQYLRFTFRAIAKNAKTSNIGYNGEALIKKYLISRGMEIDNISLEIDGQSAWLYIMWNIKEIMECVISGNFASLDLECNDRLFLERYFANAEVLYAGVLAQILGLSSYSLINLADYLYREGISFSKVANTNAYLFGVVSNILSLEEVEYIANAMGVADSEAESLYGYSIKSYRAVVSILQYFRLHKYSSYFTKTQLLCSVTGSILTRGRHYLVRKQGYYISDFIGRLLRLFISENLGIDSWKYADSNKWVDTGVGFIRELSQDELQSGLDMAIKFGLLIADADNIISYYKASAHNRLFSHANRFSMMEINAFKQELGRQGYADLAEYCSQGIACFDIRSAEYRASVLQALKQTCTNQKLTLKVLDRVTYAYADMQDNVYSATALEMGYDVIVFSDIQHLSINSLSVLAKSLSPNSICIILGDMSLGALGAVELFKYLKRYLPFKEVLSSAKTTSLSVIECENENLSLVSILLAKYHNGTITDDEKAILFSKVSSEKLFKLGISSRELSVISCVSNIFVSYSNYSLNNMLEQAINITSTSAIVWGMEHERYRLKAGDRVVATKTHVRQGYSDFAGNCFKRSKPVVIPQGSIGKYIGVVSADSVYFNGDYVISNYAIADDAGFLGKDRYFIAVGYGESIVLYHAYLQKSRDIYEFSGADACYMQLAYCVGIDSSNKLGVLVLGKDNKPQFSSKALEQVFNSYEYLYIIGSVDTDLPDSQLSLIKKCYSSLKYNMLGDIL